MAQMVALIVIMDEFAFGEKEEEEVGGPGGGWLCPAASPDWL